MKDIHNLLQKNREWADRIEKEDPDFFHQLAKQQSPEYLWIGCSDSRVPANQIIGMAPGEIFVHRNIANVVVHTDLNCLSVIQYAVDQLKIKHILIVGHYGCGGVHAALNHVRVGLADNWLRHVGDVAQKHDNILSEIDDPELRHARLCELNVIEQVVNACRSTIVQDAWARGQKLMVHGWVYSLKDGRVSEMGIDVGASEDLKQAYENALAFVPRQGRRD